MECILSDLLNSSWAYFSSGLCIFLPQIFFIFVLSVTGRGSTKGAGLSSLVTLVRNRINRLSLCPLYFYGTVVMMDSSCDHLTVILNFSNVSAECRKLLTLNTTELWSMIICSRTYATNYEAICHAPIYHRSKFTCDHMTTLKGFLI